MEFRLSVNGRQVTVDVLEDTPLLWVLRDALEGPNTGESTSELLERSRGMVARRPSPPGGIRWSSGGAPAGPPGRGSGATLR